MGIKRITWNDISLMRLFEASKRRVFEIPHTVLWYAHTEEAKKNRNRILAFRDQHVNDRCFIMGNGPSLGSMNLSLLANEVTFGLNRIYLLFEKMGFQPTYYVCVNELVLEQFAAEIQALQMPKFLNWNRRKLFDGNDINCIFVKTGFGLSDIFQTDIMNPVSGGSTVTYVALQIAFYMGFKEVILVGVDHNFFEKGTPNTTQLRKTDTDPNHFNPNYFPKGFRWQFPDLRRSEIAYEKAREVFQKHGRRVLDATAGGKLTVFEKVDFDSLF